MVPDISTKMALSPVQAVTSVDLRNPKIISVIPADWNLAKVSFSHASLRDFLSSQGDHQIPCPIIPTNINWLQFVLLSLQVLESDILDTYLVNTLKTYATNHWFLHLDEIDMGRVNRSDVMPLAQKLSSLFSDGRKLLDSIIGSAKDFVQLWFCQDRFSSLVRSIITDHLDDIDKRYHDWAVSLLRDPRALFRPLVWACSEKWLKKTGWAHVKFEQDFSFQREVWILYAFSKAVRRLVMCDLALGS